MGVRGLTTYIARNSDKFLEYYELHDCYLVIDGNNLAAQLYKSAKCYDCFGGDYDVYKNHVSEFFENLKKCNITPLIVLDGCYEDKKLRTIYKRVKARVQLVAHVSAYNEVSQHVFPLFLRELFTETILNLGLKAIRCDFEADYEMACMARTLNCPILSYDSDFYIFDVLYVPFSSIHLRSRRVKKKNGNSYHVIDCQLYKIDTFLQYHGGMDKENLPLFAVLLGNDYIKLSIFKKFYKELKLIKKKGMPNNQQRRIETVIKWLREETYDSAAKKILGRIKYKRRQFVAKKMKEVAEGYICEESKILPLFNLTVESKPTNRTVPIDIDLSTIPSEDDESGSSESEENSDESGDEDIEIAEMPSDEIDSLQNHYPKWFLNEYQSSNYPAWFLDIAIHNRYFFIPHVENYHNVHTHHISVPLLQALQKILTSGTKHNFLYIARRRKGIKNHEVETSSLDLPTLSEVENIDKETLKTIVLKILNIDDADTILCKFPEDWHIFILSIFYWVQNTEYKITSSHIYSVLLCAITLKMVDKRVGYIRTLKKVERCISSLENDEKDENNISKLDCYNFLKEMVPRFYMDEKMCRNPRLYDINIVDTFAQFQSCLFHIKYVNKLLRNPYPDFIISDFYNGTCIYNVFNNLSKRTNALVYLEVTLKKIEGIYKYFVDMAEIVTNYLETEALTGKKRRKRKNRNKSNEEAEEVKVVCLSESDENVATVNLNNPYTLLNLV